MAETIILASGSPFRQAMLRNAGIAFEAVQPDIDERAVEAPLRGSGATPEDVALVLAEAKALEVAETRPGTLVLGCDQTLSLGDEVFHKPTDMEGARRHLLALSGKTHQLNSAAVLVRDGATLWRHVGVASLTMRKLDAGFHRPASRARRDKGAFQRRRLPDRGRGHPALRKGRGRLFHHRRPAAACRAGRAEGFRCDRWLRRQEGLRLRPSDRAFALAENPRLLAAEIWHCRKLYSNRRRAGRLSALSRQRWRRKAFRAAT